MTQVLFAHRDSDYFAPLFKKRFKGLHIICVKELPAAESELAHANIIIAVDHHFNAYRLGLAKQLQWVQTMTTGTDAIEKSKALKPEVILTTTRGIHAPQMSEMAFTFMLHLARDFTRLQENQKRHRWERWDMMRLFGKTISIVGIGLTAEALAPRCKAFGMRVIGVSQADRSLPGFDEIKKYHDIKSAVAEADFTVVLAPYRESTHHLINAEVLKAMKPSAFLINLARGRLCDEQALIQALRDRQIAGAGLDVFTQEPLPTDSPLWDLDNVLISPHCSGGSDDNLRITWPILEHNMQCFLEKRPQEMKNIVRHQT